MIENAIPILVFFLMFLVGAGLKWKDFEYLKTQPVLILTATVAQLVLLPTIAWLLLLLLKPEPMVAAGMLLVSICPGGAVSNVYTFLARANTALSVTLTTINSLIATVVLPVLLVSVFPLIFELNAQTDGLMKQQSLQLALLLIFPVVLGMLLRYIMPCTVGRAMPTLESLGALGLLTLLLTIFFQFQQQIVEQLLSLLALAVLFTVASLLLACFICFAVKAKVEDSVAVMIEFPVRNLALTALIAVSVFHDSEYLLFAAVFFVVQTPIIAAVMIWHRLRANRLRESSFL